MLDSECGFEEEREKALAGIRLSAEARLEKFLDNPSFRWLSLMVSTLHRYFHTAYFSKDWKGYHPVYWPDGSWLVGKPEDPNPTETSCIVRSFDLDELHERFLQYYKHFGEIDAENLSRSRSGNDRETTEGTKSS